MPEYLAPGVYVEEVSFRPKSIEGVSTSVAGFIGPTRYGPTEGRPELLTSFADYSRIFGGIDSLQFEGAGEQINYMAHAVRAFFDNGGSKLYVTRVYEANPADQAGGVASWTVGSPPTLKLRARFPGAAGRLRIVFAVKTTPNLLVAKTGQPAGAATVAANVSGVRENDVVYIKPAAGQGGSPKEGLYDAVKVDDDLPLIYKSPSLGAVDISQLDPTRYRVHRVTLNVLVRRPGRFEDDFVWLDVSPHPLSRNALAGPSGLFTGDPKSRLNYLTIPFAIAPPDSGALPTSGAQLLESLVGTSVLEAVARSLNTADELKNFSPAESAPSNAEMQVVINLDNGNDGLLPNPAAYDGDDSKQDKTGLKSFEDVDEISIVAAPGYSANYTDNPDRANQIVQSLIIHCQLKMRYRVAVLDAPNGQVLSEVQAFRGQFDSTHAALYYPWITILDPLDRDGRQEIELPPSGFVAGIYARTDVLHGVSKAPANEVVLGAIGFETLLNKAQQDVLNPFGINCFRFFVGRGYRLWGARTISSDPEWKYISVRRYFAYLEHSIDKGTQWAVFENNSEPLWANVRQTVEDFLFNEWRNSALMGTKPEEAFFVRCDRSTMTQNDLDNGRLICLIGVAVVKPAEFVIFRIGQAILGPRS